jgi:hypothetical protein
MQFDDQITNCPNMNTSGAFTTKRCKHAPVSLAWSPVCKHKIIHEQLNELSYIKPGGVGLMELVITFQVWLKSDKNEFVLLRVSRSQLATYSTGETYAEVKSVRQSVTK